MDKKRKQELHIDLHLMAGSGQLLEERHRAAQYKANCKSTYNSSRASLDMDYNFLFYIFSGCFKRSTFSSLYFLLSFSHLFNVFHLRLLWTTFALSNSLTFLFPVLSPPPSISAGLVVPAGGLNGVAGVKAQ